MSALRILVRQAADVATGRGPSNTPDVNDASTNFAVAMNNLARENGKRRRDGEGLSDSAQKRARGEGDGDRRRDGQ